MSLINQALKKEQQRRSLNLKSPSVDIPTYHSEPLTASSLSKGSKPKNPLAILIGLTSLGILMLVCGGTFVYFGKSYLSSLNSAPVVATAETEASDTPSAAPENPLSKALAANKQQVEAAEAISAESDDAQLDNAASPSSEAESIETLQEPAATPSVETAIPEPVAETPKFNIDIQTAIDGLQVHGFRSAGANSRLLMNGRVFGLNDIVNLELEIRFKGSKQGALIFEDSAGFEYQKTL